METTLTEPTTWRRHWPTWTLFLIGGLAIGCWLIYQHVDDRLRDAYAQWWLGDMVIEYLKRNDRKWPRSWDDLAEPYEICVGRSGRPWSFDELRSRVDVDFSVHSDQLRALAHNTPPPRVIFLRDGTDSHWAGHEPNQMVQDYLARQFALDPLSVEETLGAVRYFDDEDSYFHILAHANPAALPMLRKLRDDPQLKPEHRGNVFVMLGYVGDHTDVAAMETLLSQPFDGNDPDTQSTIDTMLSALGLLSRRQVKEADELLSRMATHEFWRKRPIAWYAPKNIKFTNDDVSIERVISAWATSKTPAELREVISSAANSASTPEGKKYILEFLGDKHLDIVRNEWSQLDTTPVTANVRRDLRAFYREMQIENSRPAVQ